VLLSEVAAIVGVRAVRPPYRLRRAVAAGMQRLRLPGALDPGFVDMARYPIVVDATRAREELGWNPRDDSEAALRRFAATVRRPPG
jgi:nucleoside-diphosphate-sugar epimerase